MRQKLGILTIALGAVLLSVTAAVASSVAVFPMQELGDGRNDANLNFTRILAERLADSGNEIIGLKAVIAYMAINRIRSVGHLETYNIYRVRDDLGATFVLLGTITQRKERPEPSMGITLQLVRTSDARTVWTFVDSLSAGEERRILGIGEPRSSAALQPLLLERILKQWPWQMIKGEQPSGSINIESVVLEPRYLKPGEEVHSLVRLRNFWRAGLAPRVFFKVDEQLYPATVSSDGSTYEGTWVAGEKDGRFPVDLLLAWPRYGRTETALLGSYMIDATSPLFEIDLNGTTIINGIPVFNQNLVIIPRMLLRKALSRWRLAFYSGDGNLIGDMSDTGNFPVSFIWSAENKYGSLDDGIYQVVVEAWDQAGNPGKATKRVRLNRSMPFVRMETAKTGNELVVDLKRQGSVPLAFWRMQMWTKEGNLLSHAEGRELPVKIGVELPDAEKNQNIEGFLFVQDILGNQTRTKVKDLLPKLSEKEKEKVKKEKPKGVSESWVDEF